MKKNGILRCVLGSILSAALLLTLLPAQALSAGIRREWIVEFADSAAARSFAADAEGTYLGGPFVLARVSEAQLEGYPVVSLTENGSMEGCSVSNPTDELVSEQYILTHKSWYGQDAWAALESFLSSQSTPLTPADCNTVRVAVLDSGIDAAHEDLADRVTAGWDAIRQLPIEEGVNSDVSEDSHGTKVAGLIGAASDNAIGIAGAAWTFPVELIPVRVLDSSNKGTVADIVAAIYWAVDEGNADILNLSFGRSMKSVPAAMQTAVLHAVEKGVIVVAAAGNNGEYHDSDHYYPASLEGVLPVGSTAETLGKSYGNYNNYVQRAEFSNWPYYETDCGKTFFFTPGENLLTTSAGNSYETFTGTSASAAMLSGMLAALRSCADTTGQPAVENYLSYNKYSYLGGLYYQDYKYMADALVAGYTSGDVRFDFDDHLPDMLIGTVELSGILNDPALRYTEIRLYVEDVLVDTAARTETAKQYISFTMDTTAFADGHYYSEIDIMGVLEDETEEKIEQSFGFDICNDSICYTVAVSSGGEPLVAASCYLFSGSGSPEYVYSTDNLGQIYLSPEHVGEDASLLILGEDLTVYRSLAQYPAGNRYSFGGDPALLTIRCSGDTLDAVDGAAIRVSMPDGEQYEVGTVTGGETELWVDTDLPITFTVCGTGAILTETVDLSGDDAVWDLDSTETATITLIHDGEAPTEGTDGPVRFLGLEIDGFGEQLLDADGGSILVPPGEYSVTGYVYWWDGNYYSNYIKADLGTHDVTEEDLILTLGSGVPVASVSVGAETVTEGQSVSVALNFADSNGNAIAELGSSDAECSYREKYRYVNLSIEEYDAESETWNEINQINLNQVPGSTTVKGGQLGTQPGRRRIAFYGEDFISGMAVADAMAEFALLPQETRPAATVRLSVADSYGYNIYDLSAAAVLTDAEGNSVVREAYSSEGGNEAIIKLPIGEIYALAVVAVDYSTAYMTVCEADLTAAAAGDEVLISLAADDSWITHEIPMPEYDGGCGFVRNLACIPFEDFPAYRLVGSESNGHIELLYTSGLTETALFLDVMPDSYEMENYEYPPVFTMKLETDLSEASTQTVGLPESITLGVKKADSDVILTPVITDAYGNPMTDAGYVCRYGDMGGGDIGEGDVSGVMPTMVYPVISVYDSEGDTVFTDSTAFAPVTVRDLADGGYSAVITWNSSDISMTGAPVGFAIGESEEPPVFVPAQPVPTAFRAAASDEGVTLSWTAPQDGCEGYVLLRDGTLLAELEGSAETYLDETVLAGSYYMYTLYALGASGEKSEPVTAGVRLGAAADVTPPVWSGAAQLSAGIGSGGVELSWSRAQDNGSGVSGYLLFCNGDQIAQLFTRRYTFTVAAPDAEYIFSVKAVDGAGNVSAPLEAAPVSFASGLLGVETDYARNRLGYMTGKNLILRIRTTSDLDSVSVAVDYTDSEGGSGTLMPDMTGESGSFGAIISLPDDFSQVDQITVTCGGEEYPCLEEPIVRCASRVEVEVDLADAAELYPSAVLTLYAPSVGYAYSWPISNMAGTVEEDVIASDDYRLTLADSAGNVLLVRQVDLSADARITLGAEDARFLQLTVEGGNAGLAVSVTTDGKTTSGKLDESGTVVWSSGGRFLPVGSSGTVYIPEWEHGEELTFDKVVNQKAVRQGYKTVSIPVTVLDPGGEGISGIEVQIEGSDETHTETTGADGTCVFTFENRRYHIPYLFMQQQRDDQNRILASVSIPVIDDTAVLRPTMMYEQIMIRPILDVDVDPESVSFTVNEKPVSLKDGALCVGRTDWWKTGERVIVSAEYTADGVTYVGRTGYDLTTQTQTVELNMKKSVEVTVSLSDNGDPVKGAERYFAVYNTDREMIAAFSTYQTSAAVTLAAGEQYTVLAGWDKLPMLNDYYHSVRATIIAEEGCEVALDMVTDPGRGLSTVFLRENGLNSGPSVSVLDNGDIRVTLNLTACSIEDEKISEAYNMLTLPAGARDIICSTDYTFDEETGLMKLSDNLAEWSVWLLWTFEKVSFTIPADRIPTEFLLQSLTRYCYEGEERLRVNNEFELADYLMRVDVPGRISASALQSDGLPLDIWLPFAQPNGKLEVYADDALLTAGAADPHERMVVHPENRLGECTLRVVYTAENGFTLSREAICEIIADTRPVLQSANVWMAGKYIDLLNPSGQLLYNAANLSGLRCKATFSHTELVESVWLCGQTESEFDRFELFWSDEEDAFIAEGQIGTQSSPFTALWIEFDEKVRPIEETAKDVRGELTAERDELTYPAGETGDSPYSYAPDPDLGEAVQAQALSDWEKYVQMVNDGLYEMEGEDTVAALNELFGEDGVWDLPAATDGEHHFSMSYGYDPETVARKLASDEAFTVKINGEERKVLIEFEEEGGDLYICYYGLGDLFVPAVPETGEPMMAAAGSLLAGLRDFVKRHWEDGMAIKEKYDEYEWLREGLKEEFSKDPEGGDDDGSGDPCSGAGGQTREERREQVDEMFDEGWEASKAVAEGISMVTGALGLEASMFGEFITQDGGAAHALFELQKQRVHELDDALDAMNEDAFPDEPADPCKKEEPPKGSGQEKTEKKKHPRLSYQPVYPLIDPSGYLYEGACGYPAVGVNAYLYCLDTDGETWVLWNSEDFGQGPNPYPSEENGYYGWDVLPGRWKVVFEGEGYARAESIVLDVPPPHLDVHIAMTSTRDPAVADAAVRADGSIYLKFDHLMTLESVLNNAVTVTLGGEVLSGTLEAVDAAQTAPGAKQAALDTNVEAGLEVASVFRFVPDDALLAGMTVRVSVDRSVLGYNERPMLADWSESLQVPEQNEAMTLISLDRLNADGIYLASGETRLLDGDDWRAVFSDGFGTEESRTDIAIEWYTTDESVAVVDEAGKITAVGGGIASVIGEYEGRTVVFGVSVTRAPITADAADNAVKFCRENNLVLGKACYMWSAAANFRMEDPVEGDEKYLPVAWRVKENDAVKAEGTVSDGEASVRIIYTPIALGTLTGEIDYQKYVFSSGRWAAVGGVETAATRITVTEVTALALHTAPRVTVGGILDLSDMLIDISLSDGSVSTVGYAKLASYGIAMDLQHGELLDAEDTQLTLTHGRTGLALKIDLGADGETAPATFLWRDNVCTVQRKLFADGVTVIAASYEDGRMVGVVYLTAEESAAVLTGDEVRVFFLDETSNQPVRKAVESQP